MNGQKKFLDAPPGLLLNERLFLLPQLSLRLFLEPLPPLEVVGVELCEL